MGKLFNLKEWLTVNDAARHLSIAFGEDVTEADVLRLALDGRLRLSVNFVNGARAQCGKIVPIDEARYREIPTLDGDGTLKLYEGPQLFFEGRVISVVELEQEVCSLLGIYDLPMIGNERLDIEHEYQNLTGGPAVTLQSLDGALVEGRDGQICQLQESFDDNEYQPGSSAQLERLKQHIAENGIEGAKAESLLDRHKEQRKVFLEKQRSSPAKNNYYPAHGLPEDAVIVVRAEALRELEESLDGTRKVKHKPLAPRAETTYLNINGPTFAKLQAALEAFDPKNLPRSKKAFMGVLESKGCDTREQDVFANIAAEHHGHSWRA